MKTGSIISALFSLTATTAIGTTIACTKRKHHLLNSIELPDDFTITAHTGAMNSEPNTVRSILVGADYGAKIIEIDLQQGCNGEPVLSHDTPKGGETTVDEAFRIIESIPDIKVNLDIKDTAVLTRTQELAEKHGLLPRVFCTGIAEKDAAAIKKYAPKLPFYLNVRFKSKYFVNSHTLEEQAKTAKELGAIGFNIDKCFANKQTAAICKKYDLKLSVWTVNKKREAERVIMLSPNNITTKRPDILHTITAKTKRS